MTRRIEIRPAAQADLLSIGEYTDAHWGRDQARSYLATISNALDRLASNPFIGSDQAHLAPGYRKLHTGSHNLYYRHDGERIVLVRVLHASMDVGRVDWTGN